MQTEAMLSTSELLLASAQCLFMVLPITGLVMLTRSPPTESTLSQPRMTTMVAATVACSLLTTMFALEGSYLFTVLAGANFILRFAECLRYATLVLRAPSHEGAIYFKAQEDMDVRLA